MHASKTEKDFPMPLFKPGSEYKRSELHDQFGGSRQSGISPSRRQPIVMLFTSDSGEQHGYHDGWVAPDRYEYCGEGQRGDMVLARGNKAIHSHASDNRELHLFERTRKGYVQYVGSFEYASHDWRRELDSAGLSRSALIFTLRPVRP
jgi:5-methylcytosine-specific restriction protein A